MAKISVAQLSGQIIAWALYLGVPLAGAILFFLAATLGSYPLVDRLGGAAWTFFLVLIITMPALSGYLMRRARV